MALLLLIFFFLLLLTATTTTTNSTYDDDQELETSLQSLRTHGYTLFTNAITTSDLQYQLLTSHLTLFAPTNTPLFSLDMASQASHYVKTLRYHVVPDRRLTFSDLQNLSNPFLDTLLPHYSLLIGKTIDDSVLFNGTGLMVDGVRVSEPDLFLGPRIAVHGIDGVLEIGLNMRHQDFGGSTTDNGSSGLLSPAESPAPLSGFDWNVPAEGSPVSMPHDNIPVQGSPVSVSRGNIPAEGSHAPVSGGNIPAEGSPASMPRGNIPVQGSPASMPRGNIPAEGIFPPIPEFDWSRVPLVQTPTSQPHGKIPGRADNVGKKKRGKRHHRRHGHRHRDHRLTDHRLKDL